MTDIEKDVDVASPGTAVQLPDKDRLERWGDLQVRDVIIPTAIGFVFGLVLAFKIGKSYAD